MSLDPKRKLDLRKYSGNNNCKTINNEIAKKTQ